MSCTLTTSWELGCNDSVGGIIEAYIGDFSTAGAITENASGMVTTIAGLAFMYTYQVEKATSNWTDIPTPSRENGTVFFDQNLQLILNKMSQDKRNEVKSLSQGLWTIIVKDRNGKYWLLGQTAGMRMDPSESGSGTAMGDRNGYTLNFKGEEPAPANEVDSTIIAALLA